MFGIFKKKSKVEKLQKKYEQLLDEAYRLSKINRSESDKMYSKAELVMNQLVTEKGRI